MAIAYQKASFLILFRIQTILFIFFIFGKNSLAMEAEESREDMECWGEDCQLNLPSIAEPRFKKFCQNAPIALEKDCAFCREIYYGIDKSWDGYACIMGDVLKNIRLPGYRECLIEYKDLRHPRWDQKCDRESILAALSPGFIPCILVYKGLGDQEWYNRCNSIEIIQASKMEGFNNCLKVYLDIGDSKWWLRCKTPEDVGLSYHDNYSICLKTFKDFQDPSWYLSCNLETLELFRNKIFTSCISEWYSQKMGLYSKGNSIAYCKSLTDPFSTLLNFLDCPELNCIREYFYEGEYNSKDYLPAEPRNKPENPIQGQ